MNIGRKRNLLIEKVGSLTKIESYNSIIRNHFSISSYPYYINEFYKKNRFAVQLEDNSESILVEHHKIVSFNMTNELLSVGATLLIDEWIEDFKKVSIAKIEILDVTGSPVKIFDLDVLFLDYNVDFNYNHDDIMTPKITYKILK